QGLVDHLADRAQRVLGRNPLLEVDVAEHRVLLLLISTHATYITYLPVERLVPFQIPATFSAASSAVPQAVVIYAGFRFSVESQSQNQSQKLLRKGDKGLPLPSMSRGHAGVYCQRRTNPGAIEQRVVFEHAEDGVQQLAHDRYQRHHLALTAFLQSAIVGA